MTETLRVIITCPHCQREYPIYMGEGRLAELKAKATCSRCGKSFPTAGQVLVEDPDEGLEVFEETTPTHSRPARNTLRPEDSMPGPPPVPPSPGNRAEPDAPVRPAEPADRNITGGGLAALLDALSSVAGEEPAGSREEPGVARGSAPTADRVAARPEDGEEAEARGESTSPPSTASPVKEVGSWDTALESALAQVEVPQANAPVSSEAAAAGGEAPGPSASNERAAAPGPVESDAQDVAPGPAESDEQDAAPGPAESNTHDERVAAPSESDARVAAPCPAASDERTAAPGPPEETVELAASLLQQLPLCSSHIALTPFDAAPRPSGSVAALEWLLDVGAPDRTGSEPNGGHEGS